MEKIDSGYRKHVSDGFVSLVGDDRQINDSHFKRYWGSCFIYFLICVVLFIRRATGDFVKRNGVDCVPCTPYTVILSTDQVKGGVALKVQLALLV